MSDSARHANLAGRVAVVTGASSGMGKATAAELAGMGAEVVLACRDARRGQLARDEIVEATGNDRVEMMELDLASLASVCRFAETFGRRFCALDVLVNNAAASVRNRQITVDGFERHWATNVLGPQLLTMQLLDALRAARWARVIEVSTRAASGLDLSDTQYERRRFNATGAYRASKQAGRMLGWGLAARLRAGPVTVNAVNPGYVMTDLTRNVGGPLKALVTLTSFMAQTPAAGADTAIWLAASPDVEGVSGAFFNKRREIRCRYRDEAQIERLWTLVERDINEGLARASAQADTAAACQP